MMKKLMDRLKSKAGETLVESLASILIFTFGSIIMYSMVMSAANMNEKTQKLDEAYRNQIEIVETGPVEKASKKQVVFKVGSETEQVIVDLYKDDAADSLYAYYPSAQGGVTP